MADEAAPETGFDLDFFMGHLQEVVTEYREHRNLTSEDLIGYVTLANNVVLAVTGFRVGPNWVLLFTEDDQMHFAPMKEVVGVTIGRRPPPPPGKRPVGFNIAEVEGS
jgi:hypothetical protein